MASNSISRDIARNTPGFSFDNSYTDLPEILFSRLPPVPVRDPEMVILNTALADELGLDFSGLSSGAQAQMFGGNMLPPGADPIAQAYAGHQFGFFTVLGDGRAIVWGEHITPDGRRCDIQFKGSGRTPYSRSGDGRAALGPMLREYIISEAMHALGIPTTRSLAVATTGETVNREDILPGAVLTRVAQSHIRVGTFEFAAAHQDRDLLEKLLDYTIARHDPALADARNRALALIKTVMQRQADLVAQWMRVGFIHGVMNTDNMAISGESIDYGPCAFMDEYHPATVFSAIDETGRYAYANQPPIAQWNLARFAETLLPLIHDDMKQAVALAEETINSFSDIFREAWMGMMRLKLGLSGPEQAEDFRLASDLLAWMQDSAADYTNTFRDLTNALASDTSAPPPGDASHSRAFAEWHGQWRKRLRDNPDPPETAQARMRAANPAIIPRNHHVDRALTAAGDAGDMALLKNLLAALKNPDDDRPEHDGYTAPPAPSERIHRTFCGT